MKILVLGATGFIGGHIARAGLDAGWEVRGFRRDETRIGHLGGLPVNWVLGDLMDFDSLLIAMDGVEIVFHAAGFYPKDGNPRRVKEFVKHAKEEIANVIEAAKQAGIQRLIYTSSLTTIGHPPSVENRLADERDFYIPGTLSKSAYYETKFLMEQAILQAASEGLDTVVLNPTAVFGPGDVYLTMGKLLIAVARGFVIGWLPGETNVVDARDVGKAHITAVDHGRSGERYIIGCHNYSIKQAITEAAQVAGVQPPRFEVPLWIIDVLVFLGDIFPFIPLPSNHIRALKLWQAYNTEKAQQVLGLSPRPFEETVRDTLAWIKSEGR